MTTTKPARPLQGAAAASAERRESVEALASMVVEVFGTDMIRAKLGRDRALALLRLAGRDTARIASSWAVEEPRRQWTTPGSSQEGYDRDPRYDPEVMQLIQTGAPHTEINAAIAVAQQRLLDNPKIVGPPGHYRDTGLPNVRSGFELYRDAPGEPLRERPVGSQRTLRESHQWEDFPDHAPGALERGYVGTDGELAALAGSGPPVRVPSAQGYRPGQPGHAHCGHENPATAKFCGQCGRRLPSEVRA
jgi:hypothetical protein